MRSESRNSKRQRRTEGERGERETLLTYTLAELSVRGETKRCEVGCEGKGTPEVGISRSARAKGTVTIFCSFEGI